MTTSAIDIKYEEDRARVRKRTAVVEGQLKRLAAMEGVAMNAELMSYKQSSSEKHAALLNDVRGYESIAISAADEAEGAAASAGTYGADIRAFTEMAFVAAAEVGIAKKLAHERAATEAQMSKDASEMNGRPLQVLRLLGRLYSFTLTSTVQAAEANTSSPSRVAAVRTGEVMAVARRIDEAAERAQAACVRIERLRQAADEASAAEALRGLATHTPPRAQLPLRWDSIRRQ